MELTESSWGYDDKGIDPVDMVVGKSYRIFDKEGTWLDITYMGYTQGILCCRTGRFMVDINVTHLSEIHPIETEWEDG